MGISRCNINKEVSKTRTDAPYLAPEPYRGKRNCSLYLTYVAQTIAQIKGVSYEEVVEVTRRNAERLFGI